MAIREKSNAPKCIKKCQSTQKTITVRDPYKFFAMCAYFEDDRNHETIVIPIKQDNQMVGCLSAALLPKHQISQEEIHLL